MRMSHRLLPVSAAFSLLLVPLSGTGPAEASAPHRPPTEPARPFGADCRTQTEGSEVTVHCHNPYPETDRVRLHIECDAWWDIDTDSTAVAVEPALTVRLAGRCWQDVRSVRISHQR